MNRRGFLLGLTGVIAAPAIVRVASIMPVRSFLPTFTEADFPLYLGSDFADRFEEGRWKLQGCWRDYAPPTPIWLAVDIRERTRAELAEWFGREVAPKMRAACEEMGVTEIPGGWF